MLALLYTVLVSKFTASCEIMCKCAIGIRLEIGVFPIMYGSIDVVGLRRAERHCLVRPSTAGFMIGGRARGMFFLVCR